jgi:beta-mannosidase
MDGELPMASGEPQLTNIVNLDGVWSLSSRDLGLVGTVPSSEHLRDHGTVSVPGHVQLQIGLPDPFLDTPDVVAVNDAEWIYRRTVPVSSVDTAGSRRQFLKFEGVDYFCDVWIDGKHAGHHEGMYSDWEIEITENVRARDEFELAVAVSCPWRIVDRAQPLLPATFEAGLDGATEYLKGYHVFPWDGWPMRGQTLLPFGLWRSVSLETRTRPTLTRVSVATRSIGPGKAVMTLTSEWWGGGTGGEIDDVLEIAPENFHGEVLRIPVRLLIEAGQHEIDISFEVPDPRLWWTWDLGEPNLYRATLAGAQTVFGIREFHRSVETLESTLNGRRIFLRGAWNTPTAFEGALSAASVRRDVEFLRDANGNSLNVHGYVARPELYDTADRLGILLFQQFPIHQFGPGDLVSPNNPRSAEFIPHVLGEFDAILRQTRGHASLVIWGTFAEARQNGTWWMGDYDEIDGRIADLVHRLAPDAEYHSSFCDFGEDHYWQGVIGFGEFTDNLDADTRFVSEFGCPAPPVVESLRAFVAPEALWGYESGREGRLGLPIDAAEWSYLWGHDYEGMTASVARVLHHVSPDPQTLDEFVDACGWYQWLANRYNGEIYRRKRYADIAGIRMWSLRDSSPGAKCAPLDYWQRPKMGLAGLREAYAPFLLSLAESAPLEPIVAGGIYEREVHLINDTAQRRTGSLTASLIDVTGRVVAPEVSASFDVAPDESARVPVRFTLPDEAGPLLVRLQTDENEPVRSDNWLVTVPPVFARPVRVLLLGQRRYTGPIRHALRRVGGLTLTVLDEVNRDPRDPSWSVALAEHYDVVWLTGWERAVHAFTEGELQAIADAVRSGIGFIHTGGQGSFHGGDSLGAQLDATPLADILPVSLRRNDVVWDKPPAIVDHGAGEILGIDIARFPSHGYARTTLKPGARALADVAGFPLIAEGKAGLGSVAVVTAGLIPPRRFLKTIEVETGEEEPTTGAPWDRDDIRDYDFNWPGYTPLAIHLIATTSGRETARPLPEVARVLSRTPYDALAAMAPTRLDAEVVSCGWDEGAQETRGVVRATNNGSVAARLVRAGISGRTMDCRVRDGFVDLMPGESVELRFEIAGDAGDINEFFVAAVNADRVQVAVPAAA